MKRQQTPSSVGHVSESAEVTSALMDAGQTSLLLTCSARHVYRLSDAGLMPAPIRLGSLVRWSREAILEWIAAGCPPVATRQEEVASGR